MRQDESVGSEEIWVYASFPCVGAVNWVTWRICRLEEDSLGEAWRNLSWRYFGSMRASWGVESVILGEESFIRDAHYWL